MIVREIRLNTIRSYDLYSAELHPEVTLILGKNGTGKTTLLESLYYLAHGSSFRGRDREMISHSSTRGELMLIEQNGAKRYATLQLTSDDTIKKSFTIQDKKSLRMPAKYRQPVILFEPDELRLLSSSPDRRRRFFDGMLSRLYPQYNTLVHRYQRTVMQRNELLKRREDMSTKAWEDQLFVWDMKFTELALSITRARREFIVLANTRLSSLYSSIAGASHSITASYHSRTSADTYQQTLLHQLQSNYMADSYRGYTSYGPHRDDFLVLIDGHTANETASRGEMRTIMLAFKLLEIELQQEAFGSAPLILLDDVFSELDTSREQQLMQALSSYQTIITATDLRDELKVNAHIISI